MWSSKLVKAQLRSSAEVIIIKRFLSEAIGTFLILLAVVGSGYMASNLTSDSGIRLLINCVSTTLALYLAIQLFKDLSGAHFNPIISIISWLRKELRIVELVLDLVGQLIGAIAGVALANLSFGSSALTFSTTSRGGSGQFLGEIVASAGLVVLVFSSWMKISIDRRPSLIAMWIASAYFFTASTSFANPVVTVGRMFTDSYAGIKPHSVTGFVLSQIIGGILAMGFVQMMERLK